MKAGTHSRASFGGGQVRADNTDETSLIYTFWDGVSWWQEAVVELTTPGPAAAIAVGPDGVVHVAYHDPVAQALQYARRQFTRRTVVFVLGC